MRGLIEMLRSSSTLVGSTLILLEADKRSESTLTAAPHKSLGRSNHSLADSVNNKQQHFPAASHRSHLWCSQATPASEQFSLSPFLCLPWWWGCGEKEETRYQNQEMLRLLYSSRLLALALTGMASDLKQIAQGGKIDHYFFTDSCILNVTTNTGLGIWYPKNSQGELYWHCILVKKNHYVMFLYLHISVYVFSVFHLWNGRTRI